MSAFRKYINPIFHHLSDIEDFSDLKDLSELFLQEYPFIQTLTKLIGFDIKTEDKNLKETEDEIERLIEEISRLTGDDKSDTVKDYNYYLKRARTQVDRMNRDLTTLDSPYFGKVVFKRNRTKEFPPTEITSYIGKFAYFDRQESRSLITDWRAPIANLYYQNSGPTNNLSFSSPAGTQEGDLLQKRQFEISSARISHIYDSKSGNVAADEFLLTQLQKRIGKKLTDIVATIQAQQNDIIREDINKPIIIQGVAGSGKTTILLHRIAYLLYTYQNEIKPENTLIIAPNKMFLDYISDVLPSLGVEGIEHNTYIFWAKVILNVSDKYFISDFPDDLEVKEYKGSYDFKKLIDMFFEDFEADLLEKINDPSKDIIRHRYYELKKSHPKIQMIERLNLAIEYAFAQIRFLKKTTGNFMGNIEAQELRIKKINDYVRRRVNVFRLYKDLYKFEYIFEKAGLSKDFALKIRRHTLGYFKTEKGFTGYKTEDLAPMVDLYFSIYGTKELQKDYIVADEAQDLSEFQMVTLLRIAKSGNITVAGDLAQSIIPPFYIKDWLKVIEVFKAEQEKIKGSTNVSYHQLNRCYRSTIEIIDFATKIFRNRFPSSYLLPEAVLRHGMKPELVSTYDELSNGNINDCKMLVALINKNFDDGAASVALVCRDENHANKVYDNIIKFESDIKRPIVKYDSDDYSAGLLILPVSKAKGLEFDTVIIVDLNKDNYSENELNVRLLYVALTRALHKLFIITNKNREVSPLIHN